METIMEKKRWAVLAGVIVALFSLALLSAACDGDSDDNGSGATPEDTSPTATVPADEGDSPTATEPAATEPADEHEDESASVGAALGDDFTVNLDADTATPGEVVFNVTNDGPALPHNIRVVKTDEAPDALPVSGGQVDESTVDVVASTTADLSAGESADVTADLEAGSYVVLCNVVGHYLGGMFTTFTVE